MCVDVSFTYKGMKQIGHLYLEGFSLQTKQVAVILEGTPQEVEVEALKGVEREFPKRIRNLLRCREAVAALLFNFGNCSCSPLRGCRSWRDELHY